MKRAAVASLARAAVWLLVVLWCMVPLVWWLITLISGIARANPAPPQRFVPMGPPPDAGLMINLMSSVVMLAMFFYATWCAFGVICGFGFDRSIYAIEQLAVAFGKSKKANAATWTEDDKEEADA